MIISLKNLFNTARQQFAEKQRLSQKVRLVLLWGYYGYAGIYDFLTLARYRDERRYKKYLSDKQTAEEFFRMYFPRDLPTSAKILDAGCGRGRVSAMLSQLGYEVLGFDVNNYEFWQKVDPSDFFIGDAQNIPITDYQYDLCVSFYILGYIPYDKQALQEIYRILKTGGRFIIHVTNKENLKTKFSGKQLDSYNLREYSIEEIRDLLISVGFTIESVQTEGFYSPICTRFINSIISRRMWHTFGTLFPERDRGVIAIWARKQENA